MTTPEARAARVREKRAELLHELIDLVTVHKNPNALVEPTLRIRYEAMLLKWIALLRAEIENNG